LGGVCVPSVLSIQTFPSLLPPLRCGLCSILLSLPPTGTEFSSVALTHWVLSVCEKLSTLTLWLEWMGVIDRTSSGRVAIKFEFFSF
jgi:hypothetical protein